MIKLTDKMIDQLEEYRANLHNLPEETDGIYILIEGSVTVKNDFNPADPLGAKRKEKEEKGEQHAIELYPPKATTENRTNQFRSRQSKAQVGGDRPETLDIFGAEKFLQVQGYSYYGCLYATAEKKANGSGGTTCGFIKKELLHLIPFYDLYALKHELEARYEKRTDKLRRAVNDNYKYI